MSSPRAAAVLPLDQGHTFPPSGQSHAAEPTPEADVCWICLSEATEACPLDAPCQCPRKVHRQCLARWQLQSAGRFEESFCRFCSTCLPDWRPNLNPKRITPAQPVMSIHHEGQTFLVQVAPGPEGQAKFQADVRRLLNLGDDTDFDINFECKVPSDMGEAEQLELRGMNAYDAAVYCASLTAGYRSAEAAAEGHHGEHTGEPDIEHDDQRHSTHSFHAIPTGQHTEMLSPTLAQLPSLPRDAELFGGDFYSIPAVYPHDTPHHCDSRQQLQPRPSNHGDAPQLSHVVSQTLSPPDAEVLNTTHATYHMDSHIQHGSTGQPLRPRASNHGSVHRLPRLVPPASSPEASFTSSSTPRLSGLSLAVAQTLGLDVEPPFATRRQRAAGIIAANSRLSLDQPLPVALSLNNTSLR